MKIRVVIGVMELPCVMKLRMVIWGGREQYQKLLRELYSWHELCSWLGTEAGFEPETLERYRSCRCELMTMVFRAVS